LTSINIKPSVFAITESLTSVSVDDIDVPILLSEAETILAVIESAVRLPLLISNHFQIM